MSGHRFTSASDAMSFMNAGNATITAVSVATRNRFTYRVRESDDGKCFFVGLLSGPDNTASYTYMGVIRGDEFKRTAKSKIGPDAPSYKAFRWLFDMLKLNKLPDAVEVWHEGSCGRCGRKLTVPESIASGIGPECSKHVARATPQFAFAV